MNPQNGLCGDLLAVQFKKASAYSYVQEGEAAGVLFELVSIPLAEHSAILLHVTGKRGARAVWALVCSKAYPEFTMPSYV
jgi:hypothetical protein